MLGLYALDLGQARPGVSVRLRTTGLSDHSEAAPRSSGKAKPSRAMLPSTAILQALQTRNPMHSYPAGLQGGKEHGRSSQLCRGVVRLLDEAWSGLEILTLAAQKPEP